MDWIDPYHWGWGPLASCGGYDDEAVGSVDLQNFCESVETTNKMHLVTEFIIPPFIKGSTCFERYTAHHQEL